LDLPHVGEMGGTVTHIRDSSKCATFWFEKLKGRDHIEDLGIGGC
jgi:hypothetical protein